MAATVREESAPVLVACGHGTRVAAGRRAHADLRLAVGALRPGVQVRAASVDVQRPSLDEVVAAVVRAGRRGVVAPLLLSAGYHVRVDVARAVDAARGGAVAAAPLGPDPVLADVLADRLRAAGAGPSYEVVLASAGSSDARAVGDVEQVARWLGERWGSEVRCGYLSAASPSVADAVGAAASGGAPVAVATYLLAPGVFTERLAAAGAALVTPPLLPDDRLAALVLRRYDTAVAHAGW